MVRKIDYICDKCGKTYRYELKAGEKDRGILKEVLGKDFCYKCLKELKEYINKQDGNE